MSNLLPGTPIKASRKFMTFGRVKLIAEYELVKTGMTSPAGIGHYANPTVAFATMDPIKQAITDAYNLKDKVTMRARIKDLKDDMRKNATFAEEHCNNDLATLLLSGYKEAQQGGGPEIAIGGTTNLKAGDTGIVGEMKGTYRRPAGTKHVEGWSKLHSAPETAWALTAVTDVGEIFWTGVAKGVENDYKVRSGAGRRKGAFSSVVTEICRY